MENVFAKLNRKDNVVEVTQLLVSNLKLDVTKTTIESDLHNHPDYPSLLSISDTLNSYGIENVSLKLSADRLVDMPLPFIAPLEIPITDFAAEQKFTVVENVEGNVVKYFDPENSRWSSVPTEKFLGLWKTGLAMFVDADNAVGESDFKKKRKVEVRKDLVRGLTYFSIPLLLALFSLVLLVEYLNLSMLMKVAVYLTTIAGTIVSGLIIWYEIDEYNPVVTQICKTGKKVNCSAILNSDGAKIFGIGWSRIGFVYFAGSCLVLTSGSLSSPAALSLISWLNLIAVPYVFYSIYYQWRVVGQWCLLCLMVQGLLVLQLVALLGGNFYMPYFPSADFLIQSLIFFSIPALGVHLLVAAFQTSKKGENDSAQLKKLQYSKRIFDALLVQQKQITYSTEGLGIVMGNPMAKYKLTKVCNPYCSYCSLIHKELREFLHNNDNIQLQIIFTASDHNEDTTALPVRFFMSVQQQFGVEAVSKVLDTWYSSAEKDFDAFLKRYPFSVDLDSSSNEVKRMYDWCTGMDIQFTPTFFINGYQLPDIYKASDLKYFLAV